MNEATFEKIAQYLNGELSHEEQLDFESAMEKDEELAQMVKLYSTIEKEMTQQEIYSVNETALKNTLSALNAKYFLSDHAQRTHRKTAAVKKLNFLKWLPYAVAASVIIAVGLFFLIKPSPQQLANDYIAQHLSVLSLTMAGASADTMQAGISAYNNKEYNKAKLLFKGYYNNHPESSDAKKYTGFVYLTTKQYDSALYVFNDLSNIKGLYSNPGNFLKAVTLLKRNAEGDKEEAKQLLEQVVMQQSAGSKEAAEWLKQF